MSLFDALGSCDGYDVGDLGSFSQPFCDVWFSLSCTFYPNVRSSLAFVMVGKRTVFCWFPTPRWIPTSEAFVPRLRLPIARELVLPQTLVGTRGCTVVVGSVSKDGGWIGE